MTIFLLEEVGEGELGFCEGEVFVGEAGGGDGELEGGGEMVLEEEPGAGIFG